VATEEYRKLQQSHAEQNAYPLYSRQYSISPNGYYEQGSLDHGREPKSSPPSQSHSVSPQDSSSHLDMPHHSMASIDSSPHIVHLAQHLQRGYLQDTLPSMHGDGHIMTTGVLNNNVLSKENFNIPHSHQVLVMNSGSGHHHIAEAVTPRHMLAEDLDDQRSEEHHRLGEHHLSNSPTGMERPTVVSLSS
jgi:hypothetical protein